LVLAAGLVIGDLVAWSRQLAAHPFGGLVLAVLAVLLVLRSIAVIPDSWLPSLSRAGRWRRGGPRLALFEGTPLRHVPDQVGVVFQDYSRSLFQWLTVSRNIALPLKVRGTGKAARADRVAEVLASVGLAGAARHYPWQLSGGMQQRVAIARALAYRPGLLLMDEPFASADPQTRFELEDLILRIRDEFNVTVVFVTHDIDEAVYLADRVVVLSASPAVVTEIVPITLARPRDQVLTKSDEAFTRYLQRLLAGVMAS
jgi:NitT/TauT family transport system ATP-binding protein